MSTGMVERHESAAGGVIVKPQTVGVAAEQQRAIAEIQAALTVAQHRQRDEVDAIERIKTSCQRQGLAEKAEYVYNRGGKEIIGPTIDLLTVIANHWGNIQFGFRELSQANGESVIECFAWDLETNAKRVVNITVPHKRYSKSGSTVLTDPRDIYENNANYAQRRVRSCLEAIVPPDVVDDAVEQCRATLKATVDVTPETVKKLADAFGKIQVSREQLENRLGRKLDTMQPAQYLDLRRIYKSIQDGMSKASEWFAVADTDDKPAASATDKLKTALKQAPKPDPVFESQDSGSGEGNGPTLFDQARDAVESAADPMACKAAFDSWLPQLEENDAADLNSVYQGQLKTYPTSGKAAPKGKGQQGGLPMSG